MLKKVSLIVFFIILLATGFLFLERRQMPETTNEMVAEAKNFGLAQGKEAPPRSFVFDGCTLFLDGFGDSSFLSACLDHDIAYYYGGTQEERLMADKIFKDDISQSGQVGKVFQYPMYWAVRLLGDSFIARLQNASWGFGYNQ